jgi:DNA processing protein
MTDTRDPAKTARACANCLRRSWLLAVLSSRLEYRGKDRDRLLELLALADDDDLLRAVGGKRREELKSRYAELEPSEIGSAKESVEAVCRHHHGYPRALGDPSAPPLLHVAGGAARLDELASAPTVAIVGSRRATDYGMEIAKSLARGLAACGVTVIGSLDDGIAIAAHAGALEVNGGTIAVMPGGLDVSCPARRRGLFARVIEHGCAVSELPCECAVRRWCYTARDRILARISQLTIVVEADERAEDLSTARIAQDLGRTLAAVPGRVTSPVSRGTHMLLKDGLAQLVRGPEDALELLFGPKTRSRLATTAHQATPPPGTQTELEPRLRATLEQVGAGRDTPDKLAGVAGDAGQTLMALSELELMGLLARGDGGRYVPRESLA